MSDKFDQHYIPQASEKLSESINDDKLYALVSKKLDEAYKRDVQSNFIQVIKTKEEDLYGRLREAQEKSGDLDVDLVFEVSIMLDALQETYLDEKIKAVGIESSYMSLGKRGEVHLEFSGFPDLIGLEKKDTNEWVLSPSSLAPLEYDSLGDALEDLRTMELALSHGKKIAEGNGIEEGNEDAPFYLAMTGQNVLFHEADTVDALQTEQLGRGPIEGRIRTADEEAFVASLNHLYRLQRGETVAPAPTAPHADPEDAEERIPDGVVLDTPDESAESRDWGDIPEKWNRLFMREQDYGGDPVEFNAELALKLMNDAPEEYSWLDELVSADAQANMTPEALQENWDKEVKLRAKIRELARKEGLDDGSGDRGLEVQKGWRERFFENPGACFPELGEGVWEFTPDSDEMNRQLRIEICLETDVIPIDATSVLICDHYPNKEFRYNPEGPDGPSFYCEDGTRLAILRGYRIELKKVQEEGDSAMDDGRVSPQEGGDQTPETNEVPEPAPLTTDESVVLLNQFAQYGLMRPGANYSARIMRGLQKSTIDLKTPGMDVKRAPIFEIRGMAIKDGVLTLSYADGSSQLREIQIKAKNAAPDAGNPAERVTFSVPGKMDIQFENTEANREAVEQLFRRSIFRAETQDRRGTEAAEVDSGLDTVYGAEEAEEYQGIPDRAERVRLRELWRDERREMRDYIENKYGNDVSMVLNFVPRWPAVLNKSLTVRKGAQKEVIRMTRSYPMQAAHYEAGGEQVTLRDKDSIDRNYESWQAAVDAAMQQLGVAPLAGAERASTAHKVSRLAARFNEVSAATGPMAPARRKALHKDVKALLDSGEHLSPRSRQMLERMEAGMR